ncbi:MAG: hypothetical protein JJT89_07650 [Nitriliruptoraceae bacterium]|nr:hypothetical protein [Nitriliruptoraceae bacterium]
MPNTAPRWDLPGPLHLVGGTQGPPPAPGPASSPDPERLIARLIDQAYLFDDPAAYEAGVRDAVQLLRSSAAHPAGGRAR